jgi:hypothetical protein
MQYTRLRCITRISVKSSVVVDVLLLEDDSDAEAVLDCEANDVADDGMLLVALLLDCLSYADVSVVDVDSCCCCCCCSRFFAALAANSSPASYTDSDLVCPIVSCCSYLLLHAGHR